jgi:hypothetical protein
MASEYDSHSERADEKEDDPRVRATSRIWGMMIPILALSIPICAISHLGVTFPFIALMAAGAGTACVWIVGGKGGSKENKRVHDRIKELEERLANVETISHFEMQLAARGKGALENSQTESEPESSQPQSSQKESA